MFSWRYLVSLPAALVLFVGALTLDVSDDRALAFEMPENQGPLTLSLAAKRAASAPNQTIDKPLAEPTPEPKKQIPPQKQPAPKPKPIPKPIPKPVPKPLPELKSELKPEPVTLKEDLIASQDTQPKQTQPEDSSVAEDDVPPEVDTQAPHQSQASAPVWVDKPRFMERPRAPGYPRLARRRGMEGVVMIEVLFNRFGEQLSLELVESSGFGILDDAALAAVRDWQFAAPSDEGDKFKVRVPVRFDLN